MDTRRFPRFCVSIFFIFASLAACTPEPPPTPYIPPTPAPASVPLVTFSTLPSPTHPPSEPTPLCTDNLAFREDRTIPDNTLVTPGSSIDKQWLIQNTGSCDWNGNYRLRFIGGSLMGATAEQALVPARAGKEAVVRIWFTAPDNPGQYVSLWQAYDPRGIAFGEEFQVTIVVQP